MGLMVLTRWVVAFEPPLAPSFSVFEMESVEMVEPPLALSFSRFVVLQLIGWVVREVMVVVVVAMEMVVTTEMVVTMGMVVVFEPPQAPSFSRIEMELVLQTRLL